MAKKTLPPKKSPFFWITIFLLVILGIVGFRYFVLQIRNNSLVVGTEAHLNKLSHLNSEEDATTLATLISTLSLEKDPQQLQSVVTALSTQSKRDIVIVNKTKVILADTFSANIGKVYLEDHGGEVDQTMNDGRTRSFIEKSGDYPQGITEIVVAIKGPSDIISGAVIMSSSLLFDE